MILDLSDTPINSVSDIEDELKIVEADVRKCSPTGIGLSEKQMRWLMGKLNINRGGLMLFKGIPVYRTYIPPNETRQHFHPRLDPREPDQN